MGTQPTRKQAKRDIRISRKKIQPELDKCLDKNDYKKAMAIISETAQKSEPNFLVSVLAAGLASYDAKPQSEENLKKISSDSVTKIPESVRENLTQPGRETIRRAVYDTLIKGGEK